MSDTSNPQETRQRALLQLLRTADIVWNASRTLFERWDLSPSQFNVLNLLHLRPEGLSQTDLSRELVMHRSNVTGLVDRLEKRGLLARHDVAADRRAYRVVLTESGEQILREILPLYEKGTATLLDHVPARRAAAMADDLETIAARASAVAEELRTQKN
jgi:DNA-binding MarR family transcriptional regulator